MQDISYILTLTSPVFILMIFGYLTVKGGWLTKENIRAMAWFVLYFGLPAAMFKALSSRAFSEILNYDYLLIFGLGSLIPFFVIFFIAKLKGKGLTEASLFGLGASVPNSLLIGFPIIMQLYGEAALVPFALTLIVENLFILPLALALADTGEKKDGSFISAFSRSFPQLLKNPIILSIGLGVLSSIFSFTPPKVMNNVIDMLAAAVGGLSLFTIGGMLVGFKARGMVADISIIVTGKLILHPIGVFIMILLIPGIPELYQSVALVLACLPMFGIYAVIGARYSMGGLCSAVILPAILFSFVSINTVLWFLN